MSAAMQANLMLEELTDAYKMTHWMQYPKGTTTIYSYLESRGGAFPELVFFGLQYYLKRYFEGRVITNESIDAAIKDAEEIFGYKYFNEDGFRYIANELDGRLPIEIRAVPEGTVVPTKNVLMTVRNTDPRCAFLTNYFEGLLEMVWYPSTVATLSREVKREIQGWATKAGERVSPVHLNDFGFRGASSVESAGIGGMAHLVNFLGSDTVPGKMFANRYYSANMSKTPTMLSVYATEHSVVTSYGEENECTAYKSIIDNAPDTAIVSLVVDAYDTMRAVEQFIGTDLKHHVLIRDGKVVIRPDSGDPKWVAVEVLEALWNAFGGSTNARGYRVLDPHVSVIYGDYISLDMIREIMYEVVQKHRFAPSNIVFGMGGALLQKVNRDTMSFAFKCSAVEIDGAWHDVYKRPVSDMRKASKRGKLALVRNGDGFFTVPQISDIAKASPDVLQTVFIDGRVIRETTFDAVRALAEIPELRTQ